MRPSRAMASTRRRVISCPSNAMRPRSTGWAPTIDEKSVVLPDPLGPIRPTMAPSGTLIEIAWLATTPPNDLVTPSTSSSALMLTPSQDCCFGLIDDLTEPMRSVRAQPTHDALWEEHDDQHDQ